MIGIFSRIAAKRTQAWQAPSLSILGGDACMIVSTVRPWNEWTVVVQAWSRNERLG